MQLTVEFITPAAIFKARFGSNPCYLFERLEHDLRKCFPHTSVKVSGSSSGVLEAAAFSFWLFRQQRNTLSPPDTVCLFKAASNYSSPACVVVKFSRKETDTSLRLT